MIKEYTYYEADTVLNLINKIDIEEYFINYKVSIKEYNLEIIKSLMFNYKSVFLGIDNELMIFDIPSVYERENLIEVILMNYEKKELWNEGIKKIKSYAPDFGWTHLRIVVLEKQMTRKLKEVLLKSSFTLVGKFHAENNQDEKLIYELSLEV